MHINMRILNTYIICGMAQINVLSRLSLMAVESDIFEGSAQFLIIASFIKTLAWISTYNYVTCITLERYAALIFSPDYETNQRIWVSYSIILINSFISGFMAFALEFGYSNGPLLILLVFCVNNISCAIFMIIKTAAVKEDVQLTSFDFKRSTYSVSQRWQAKDNVRLAKDCRILVIGTAFQVAFHLPCFFVPSLFLEDTPVWRPTLELCNVIFQLVAAFGFGIGELFVVFTFSRHREYLRSIFGLKITTAALGSSTISTTSNLEDHFAALQNFWKN